LATEEKEGKILTELGLTTNQAKTYLALLKIGRSTVKAVTNQTKIPRQESYRILQELQEKGYVEKIIAAPYEFKAIPMMDMLSIWTINKSIEYRETKQKIKNLFQKYGCIEEKPTWKQEHYFILLPAKRSFLMRICREHDNAQQTLDLITTARRFLQSVERCSDNYEKALERGVNYRVITERFEITENLRERLSPLLAKSNLQMRFIKTCPQANVAIFDKNKVLVTVYPSADLLGSPVFLTNHPSSIEVYQQYFERCWKFSLRINKNQFVLSD
jgi:sugar-specific transcriptional regulator TrmB